jgi:DNA-binding response OmpR family regulator
MNILIAEDDLVSQRALAGTLCKWGHQVVVTTSGIEAWEVLQRDDSPPLAILDWMMPGLDGVEVCRRAREQMPQDDEHRPLYLILLTARDRKEDLVVGLEAGADDYIIKPFNREELRARLNVGLRMVGLQHRLAGRVRELHDALQKVKLLQGLLPICSYCKRIRDDQNYWQQVEGYIGAHSEARFSHAICPACYEAVVQPQLNALQKIRCHC